jgi:hypothetical protein
MIPAGEDKKEAQ